jgi:hypothetical protein
MRHLGSFRGRQQFVGLKAGGGVWRLLAGALLIAASSDVPVGAQVITIDNSGNPVNPGQISMVDRRFAQIVPTKIELSEAPLDPRARLELIRFLQADQGFAMRPFPRGHKGLTLAANGKLEPAGEPYLAMVTSEGLSAKPGDRVAITDIKIEKNKIVLLLNGGPDVKHRFLRHIQIGTGAQMSPVTQDDSQQPTGARLTLTFKDHVPELTGKQVEALLAPLISFEVKTPIQAFTDTLPPQLKAAILDHTVLVGMSTDMVLFAMGQPVRKVREMDGQMPFEEWIYGKPPEDVKFVRINGNRVIRVEVAKMGKPPVIFTKDEVDGLMRTDGTPLVPDATARTVEMGDVVRDPDRQAPAAPPSLKKPGETIPVDDPRRNREGEMKPVQFPKQGPDEHPVAHHDQSEAQDSSTGSETRTSATPSTAAQPGPNTSSQPAPANPASQPTQPQ